MLIVETQTFTVGAYRVQQRPRPDNPGFAVYIVFRGARLVGKQFSRPSESDCQWLERERREESRTSNPVEFLLVNGNHVPIVERRLRGSMATGDGSWRRAHAPTGRKRGRPRKDEPRHQPEEAVES